MPQYLLLITQEPGTGPQPGTDAFMDQRARWFAYTEELRRAGVHVAGEALERVDTATTVRVRDGETLITDGPFAETKETLGGFYLVDVPSLDEALQWASRMPHITFGSVEVRPVVDFSKLEMPDGLARQRA